MAIGTREALWNIGQGISGAASNLGDKLVRQLYGNEAVDGTTKIKETVKDISGPGTTGKEATRDVLSVGLDAIPNASGMIRAKLGLEPSKMEPEHPADRIVGSVNRELDNILANTQKARDLPSFATEAPRQDLPRLATQESNEEAYRRAGFTRAKTGCGSRLRMLGRSTSRVQAERRRIAIVVFEKLLWVLAAIIGLCSGT